MKRSVAGMALGAVVVLGGLTGCGGDDVKLSPSASASVPVLSASPGVGASVAPSPGQKPTGPIDVDPPERPAAMDNADEAGAVAAAEYYLRLTVYAAATGDTTELEAMSGEGCKFCENYISSVNELHGDGGWAEPASVSTSLLDVWKSQESSGQFRVDIEATRTSYTFSTNGRDLSNAEGEQLTIGFLLEPSAGHWIVNDFQTGDPSAYGVGD
ncbi:MAG: DUF6318 family protein [Ancrocorticia sp.]